ncbi:uncharacterized protein DUF262 [Saccharothrix carnea]|uniref:Uncharacterized protein DUF262 n=1 Tax=Saccharothrix carnea TaxID=1280637 RepID=A0A2P8I953_SACCR|nr:DUF262 domain-containing protein [Saccharothrix carnea]PSL55004.1 uncharacterized protein DUF262 [Saccharothrix carnea]
MESRQDGIASGQNLLDEQEPTLLTNEEVEELDEAEAEVEGVTYSGADFDAEGLVRRLSRGDIVIPNFGHGDASLEVEAFQRSFVWRRPQMDRFIESLLLGYPIPGIMLVQQADKRYLVLDGQQRLKTLEAFYNGIHNKVEFVLDNVAKQFKGLTYKSLNPEQRRTLDNTFITATIVRTDGTKESLEAVYQVFERLNSGGTQLTPHEIRIALYPGALVNLLTRLNDLEPWRVLYGPKSPRVRDHELVLRIIALYSRAAEYHTPLKKFLNDFLGDHRELSKLDGAALALLFEKSAYALFNAGARPMLRRPTRVNVALLEAVFVATMRRLGSGMSDDPDIIRRALDELATDDKLIPAISRATAREENVRDRLDRASRALMADA